MSTYWGLHCVTCDESTDHFANHGEAAIRQYAQLRELICGGDDFDRLNIEIDGYSWMTGDLDDFWRRHAGHNIMLGNEYGESEAL